MQKLIMLLVATLIACGHADEPTPTPVAEPAIASMRQIQTTTVKPTTPAPEQPTKKLVKHSAEIVISSAAWAIKGTGRRTDTTLTGVPSMASCQEFNRGWGLDSGTSFSWDLAPRLEAVVDLPTEALKADDLTVAPIVEYAPITGEDAHFVRAADNYHCYEKSLVFAEWQSDAQKWSPVNREANGNAYTPPAGARSLTLRIRLHGTASATIHGARVLVRWSTLE